MTYSEEVKVNLIIENTFLFLALKTKYCVQISVLGPFDVFREQRNFWLIKPFLISKYHLQ